LVTIEKVDYTVDGYPKNWSILQQVKIWNSYIFK